MIVVILSENYVVYIFWYYPAITWNPSSFFVLTAAGFKECQCRKQRLLLGPA